MALRQLTEAEMAAANLRRMARDLVLEAERLEASVGVRDNTPEPSEVVYTSVTGKKLKVKPGRLT